MFDAHRLQVKSPPVSRYGLASVCLLLPLSDGLRQMAFVRSLACAIAFASSAVMIAGCAFSTISQSLTSFHCRRRFLPTAHVPYREVGVRRTIATGDVFPHAPSQTVRDSFPSYGFPFRIDEVGCLVPGWGEVSGEVAGSAAP